MRRLTADQAAENFISEWKYSSENVTRPFNRKGTEPSISPSEAIRSAFLSGVRWQQMETEYAWYEFLRVAGIEA